MFGDLVNKVKGLKRKGGGGDDDTAEFEMGDDVLDDLEEDLDDIDDDFDEINPKFDDANKKKMRMAGIIVVILVGAYFAVDEFVLKNQEDVALTPPPLKKRPRPKKKKPEPKTEVAKEAAKEEQKAPEVVPTPDAMANAEPPQMDTPTSEPQMDTPSSDPSNDPMDTMGSNEPSMNDDSSSGDGTSDSSNSGDLNFANEGSGGSGEGSASGEGLGSGEGSASGEGSGEGFSTGSGMGDSTSEGGAVGSSSGLAPQVDTPIEYVSPPNYEALGRGLVYNCVKQHWACVDRANFFQCSKNAKWFESQSKATECMTDAVYATIEDCNSGQLQKINSNFVPKECYQPE